MLRPDRGKEKRNPRTGLKTGHYRGKPKANPRQTQANLSKPKTHTQKRRGGHTAEVSDRKSPPFAGKREGWGTLKFKGEVALEEKPKRVEGELEFCGGLGSRKRRQAAALQKKRVSGPSRDRRRLCGVRLPNRKVAD